MLDFVRDALLATPSQRAAVLYRALRLLGWWLQKHAPECSCERPGCGGGCPPRTDTEYDDWFAE